MAIKFEMDSATLKIHAVGALVCAGLLSAGYAMGVMPMMSSSESPADRGVSVREAQQQAGLQEAVAQRLQAEVEASDQTLASKPMQLLQASLINRRVAELSGLAYDHGLTLTSSQPGDETVLTYYAFVPIVIGGEGRLGDFVRFLGALHSRFPDMGVQAFDVTRDPLGGGRFSLALNWFVEPARTAEVSTQ